MSSSYLPEGQRLDTPENLAATESLTSLQWAMDQESILEGRVQLCTPTHDLVLSIGKFTGIIPREEAAMGIREGKTREIAILSRVGKPAAFTVQSISMADGTPKLICSRRRAQELALHYLLNELPLGSVIPAVVTHIESFGVFADIGCGFVSMIGIENLSVSRISHPSRRMTVGQPIYVVVTDTDKEQERVYLSHKELLGTWEENAALFTPGMTVTGYVRGIKEYGSFIELTPNLTGLADRTEGLDEDDRVSVYIKGILPDRMKIKLLVIRRLEPLEAPPPISYHMTQGRLLQWRYPPTCCDRTGMETVFA